MNLNNYRYEAGDFSKKIDATNGIKEESVKKKNTFLNVKNDII